MRPSATTQPGRMSHTPPLPLEDVMFIPICAILFAVLGFCLGGPFLAVFGLLCGAFLGAYFGG